MLGNEVALSSHGRDVERGGTLPGRSAGLATTGDPASEMFAATDSRLRTDGANEMSRHAFLLLSPPETPGKIANPLEYAVQLDDAGHEVIVWFDGDATFWFEGLEDRPAPALDAYESARDRDLIAGVCDHCATHKGVVDAVVNEGFEIAGEAHQPDVAGLVDDGFELHLV